MGLVSYNGEEKTITFRCKRCEELGHEPTRAIQENDIILAEGAGFVGVELPLCPNCKSRSYILPGQELKGPMTHLRAILHRRIYEAAGGDANLDLAKHKEFIDSMKTSYSNVATKDAKDEFDGKKNFSSADKTGKPLKEMANPVQPIEKEKEKEKKESASQ